MEQRKKTLLIQIYLAIANSKSAELPKSLGLFVFKVP